MEKLQMLLELSAQRHTHLCPRQVLGVRMGMFAGEVLGLDLPQKDKRVFTFAESDGCGTGGISVASGCSIERRTLRVVDYGKLAATFVDTLEDKAIRIIPRPDCREEASNNVQENEDRWHNQLKAYQVMSVDQLFSVQSVNLTVSLEKIISKHGLRVLCSKCCEEITNEREVFVDGLTFCRSCEENHITPYFLMICLSKKSCRRRSVFIEKLPQNPDIRTC